MPSRPDPSDRKLDPHERVKLPLDFETAVRGLLAVDPRSDPVDDDVDDEVGQRVGDEDGDESGPSN